MHEVVYSYLIQISKTLELPILCNWPFSGSCMELQSGQNSILTVDRQCRQSIIDVADRSSMSSIDRRCRRLIVDVVDRSSMSSIDRRCTIVDRSSMIDHRCRHSMVDRSPITIKRRSPTFKVGHILFNIPYHRYVE